MEHILDHCKEHEPVAEHMQNSESDSGHHKDQTPDSESYNHKMHRREADCRRKYRSRG
jgi:hypothetical protein